METRTWHALDHLCEAIRTMADIYYLHAELFESVHNRFKKAYCLSSKRAGGVMKRAINK